MRRYGLAIVFLLLHIPAWGTTYYVDATGGSDSNTGTATNNAWKTAFKVNTLFFSAGDSILFKRGETWRETIIASSSGTAGNPITFGAYGTGNSPVINGADLVAGGWSAVTSQANTWKVALAKEPKIVAFDDTLGTNVASVAGVTGDRVWCWSSGVLYVYSATNPAATYTRPGVEAGGRDSGIKLNGKHFIWINNLNFKYTNLNAVTHGSLASNAITISNNVFSDIGGTGISAYDGSSNWAISNNTFNNCGKPYKADTIFLWAKTNAFAITGNLIDNTMAGDGILLDGTNHIISNNVIRSSHPYGIEAIGSNNNIYGNSIYNSQYEGIFVKGSNYNIYRNLISGTTVAGITINEASVTGIKIYYNVIYGHKTSTSYSGIMLMAGGNGTKIYNNVLYDNARGYSGSGQSNVELINNLIFSNTQYGIRDTNGMGSYLIRNNDVWNNGVANYSTMGEQTGTNGNISLDPRVVDPAGKNFHLLPNSPLIDAGTNVSLTQGYDARTVPSGIAPEIGAFGYLFAPKSPSSIRIN